MASLINVFEVILVGNDKSNFYKQPLLLKALLKSNYLKKLLFSLPNTLIFKKNKHKQMPRSNPKRAPIASCLYFTFSNSVYNTVVGWPKVFVLKKRMQKANLQVLHQTNYESSICSGAIF